MKRYIVAAAAGLVLLVVAAVMICTVKMPVSFTVKLPPAGHAAGETNSSAAASFAPSKAVQSSADEQGLGTPEAFLGAIYTHYAVNDPNDHFSTLNHQSDYYDPELSAIMAENSRLYEGYIGALDADPICQCQDFQAITTTIRILSQDAKSAKAVAILTQAPGGRPYTVKYQLVRVGGRWRIHDLGSDNYPSMRAEYQKSNEDARKQTSSSS